MLFQVTCNVHDLIVPEYKMQKRINFFENPKSIFKYPKLYLSILTDSSFVILETLQRKSNSSIKGKKRSVVDYTPVSSRSKNKGGPIFSSSNSFPSCSWKACLKRRTLTTYKKKYTREFKNKTLLIFRGFLWFQWILLVLKWYQKIVT